MTDAQKTGFDNTAIGELNLRNYCTYSLTFLEDC